MPARISNGRWTRNVPPTWKTKGGWRTDMFKSTLADQRLREAEFKLGGGPRVLISAAELRRVLSGGKDHYSGQIWGPFDIDPTRRTIDEQEVQMEVIL